MSDVSKDELIDIGIKMAQTIQDVIDDTEEAGCDNPFPDFKELLKDWDEIYKRSGDGWQQQLADTTNEFQQEIQL